jgi:hypothetical protein
MSVTPPPPQIVFSDSPTAPPRLDRSDLIKRYFISVDASIMRFFRSNFTSRSVINHCTDENRLFILDCIEDIAQNYVGQVYIKEIAVAVVYVFYSLVLLEVLGDNVCIEEICRYCLLVREETEKVLEMYYGIAWGDDPVLARIRRKTLFPGRTEPVDNVTPGPFDNVTPN